jgi:hypothetical protein
VETANAIVTTSIERLRLLFRFMSRKGFVASREELLDFGFSRSRIKNWRRSGRLVQVAHGVYSYGRDVDTREAALRVALLVAGPGAVLTGRTACEEWGMVQPPHKIPRLIEVAVDSGHASVRRGSSPSLARTRIKIVRRQFRPSDIRKVNGLKTICPALALIDFSANASGQAVRFAFLEACRLRYLAQRDVKFCFERMVGRRGAKKLRQCLVLWVPELARIKSVLEGMFLLALVERGLPMPRVNVKLFGYEVDFYWPESKLVLEVDGNAFHRDPVQKSIDLAKQLHLESEGLTVLRADYRQVDQDVEAELDRVASHLIAA